MASVTLSNIIEQFPVGTTVYVYPNTMGGIPTGAPSAASITSATVVSGGVTFSGLANNTEYLAGAQVSSEWRYVGFSTSGETADQEAPVLSNFPNNGTAYYLDPTNGSDDNDGQTPATAFATLETAYAALTAGQHDTLFYIAGATSISLDAAFTWSKSYTHFIGVSAPTMLGTRARIFQDAAATGLSPLITISGDGCIWENIYVFQGVNDATSLVAVSVTGDRCNFKRCQFVGGGHETNNVDNSASLQLTAGSENTFDECVFGSNTIASESGSNVLRVGSNTARNVFKKCIFQTLIDSDGTASVLVEATATDSFLMWNIFEDCYFIADSVNKATSMASAFVIPAGHTTTATCILKNCLGIGFSKWDANDRNVVFGDMGTPTGIDLSGVALALEG